MKLMRAIALFCLIIIFTGVSTGAYCAAEPLTLEQSIKIAKKESPQIASAKKKVIAAEARVGQAFAGFLPTLSLEGAYGRGYQQPLTYVIEDVPVSVGPNEIAEVRNWGLKWSQVLYTGGKLSNTLGIAELGLKAAKAELKQVENDLKFDVTTAYHGIINAGRAVTLAEEALSLAKDHRREAQTMLDVGVVTKADTLRADVAVANGEHQLTLAKNALIRAKNAFNSLLGRDLGEEVILNEEDFRLDDIAPPSYEELLELAYKNRPDWLSFRYAKVSADKSVAVAFSDFLPSFALMGTYGYDYTNYPEEGTVNDVKSWTALLTGSWNIFDGLGTPQRVKEALAERESLEEDEKDLKKAIAMDVKDALIAFKAALDSLQSSKKALDLAEENHRVAKLRYTSGVGTSIEEIDAETSLSEAKLNRLQAAFDYEQAKAKINKAVGKEIFKVARSEIGNKEIALVGVVKYIDLEGGFIGFIDNAGNRYNIFGEKAKEISKVVGKSKNGKRIRIVGQPRNDIITIQMWGVPFEITSYKWL